MIAKQNLVWGLTLGSYHYTISHYVFLSHSQQLGPKRNDFQPYQMLPVGLSKHGLPPQHFSSPSATEGSLHAQLDPMFPIHPNASCRHVHQAPILPSPCAPKAENSCFHISCVAVQEGFARSLWKTQQGVWFGVGRPWKQHWKNAHWTTKQWPTGVHGTKHDMANACGSSTSFEALAVGLARQIASVTVGVRSIQIWPALPSTSSARNLLPASVQHCEDLLPTHELLGNSLFMHGRRRRPQRPACQHPAHLDIQRLRGCLWLQEMKHAPGCNQQLKKIIARKQSSVQGKRPNKPRPGYSQQQGANPSIIRRLAANRRGHWAPQKSQAGSSQVPVARNEHSFVVPQPVIYQCWAIQGWTRPYSPLDYCGYAAKYCVSYFMCNVICVSVLIIVSCISWGRPLVGWPLLWPNHFCTYYSYLYRDIFDVTSAVPGH